VTIGIDWLNRDERRAMNLIRRSAWAVVMLGAVAVAGCTGEEEGAKPNPASPPPAPVKPIVPPSAHSETAKEGTSKEMQPPPAQPDENKKPDDMKKAPEPPKVEGPKAETKGSTAAAKLTADEIAAIKQLPAADQELALKQVVCPVSDEHLGSMQKPVKVTAEGRTFFLCCDGCQKDVKADAKKVLAKLDAQAGKK
jgi:hypothetical protein